MTGEALYERYKEALRRGHVAALRGPLEEALDAYAEAARIAPERATPQTSAGSALLRHGRAADALQHFDLALRLAPGDEAALLGRAQALAALGRRLDAAETFDALAEARETGGRLAEAVDAAGRGLELAEGRERRRRLERLCELLRASELDEAGRDALDQAMRVLEGVALAVPAPPGSAVRWPLDRPLPDAPLGDLVRAAEEAVEAASRDEGLEAADHGPAIDRLLDLATACRAAGLVDAAIDACYLGLSLAPDDVDLHLALVELYDQRGWVSVAGEKAELLARLVALDEDPDAIARVTAARAARG